MVAQAVRFLAVIFAALTLAPAGAHLFALPNKIGMPRDDYFVAQQAYRGWWMMVIVFFGALFCSIAMCVIERRDRAKMILCMTAVICLLLSLQIFFLFTAPANRQTENWTLVPGNWRALRQQWEYSHAAAAVCDFGALIAVTLSLLAGKRKSRRPSIATLKNAANNIELQKTGRESRRISETD